MRAREPDMAPRKRSPGRRLWPANLHATRRADGRLYFYYLRLDLPKGHADRTCKMGYVSEQEAIDAARQLNQVFAPGGAIASQIIAKAKQEARDHLTVGQYIKHMVGKVLLARRINGHPLSARTLEEYRRLYNNLEAKIGHLPLAGATQSDLAEALTELGTTAEVFNKYRTRLLDLYANAISDGYPVEHLPARILPRDKEVKRRQRITLPGDRPGVFGIDGVEAYNAIFEKASRAVQVTMELSLNALQRREECHAWRFDWSRQEGAERWVYIRVSKTHKHGVAAYVRVPEALPVVHSAVGAKTLGDVIRWARADGIACPFVAHQRPKRVKKSKERVHPFQLTPSQISRGFAEAREAAGIYAHLPREEQPTFHELLALGEHLREKQGWTAEQLQRLRGHAKVSTTKIYLDGHEWQTVEIPGRKGTS